MEKLSAARNAALKALYETEKSGAYLNAALRTVLAEEGFPRVTVRLQRSLPQAWKETDFISTIS